MMGMSRYVLIVAFTSVVALTAVAKGGDPYDALLSNPRIMKAIESNPFIEPGTYRGFLRMKIAQIEIDQTESWNDYRHFEPHSDREITEVMLQKVALSLYVEFNELVPWSLLDYGDENLHIILGDAYSELSSSTYLDRDVLVNNNPMIPFAYAKSLRTRFPDHPIVSPQDVLDLTIMKMRDEGWVHRSSGFSYADACEDNGFFGCAVDFGCLDLTRKGTSAVTPRFIYSVLQAQNIPSRCTLWFGHGGIEFPSLELGMDGDGVYDRLESGLLFRPNFLPVGMSYLELSLFKEWSALGTCEGGHLQSRDDALQYLDLFDDPAWNADVLASYCHRTFSNFLAPGDFLRRNLIRGQLKILCQDEDPNAADYQPPALTDVELEAWFSAIAEFAPDCAACTTHADCDDGERCNGVEFCDEYGFCDIVFPMNCDDGLFCTYDRCENSTCWFPPAVYGDVNADEIVDLTDVLCVLDGFVGQFTTCDLASLDIGNCTPNDQIDLSDILAVLDAFQGQDPCCGN